MSQSRELIFERKKKKKGGGGGAAAAEVCSSASRRRSSQSSIVVSHTANSASVDSSLPTFLLLPRQVRKNLSPRYIQRDQREKGMSRPIAPRFGPPWVAAVPGRDITVRLAAALAFNAVLFCVAFLQHMAPWYLFHFRNLRANGLRKSCKGDCVLRLASVCYVC